MVASSFARIGVVIVTHASRTDVVAGLRALPTRDLAGVVVVDNASPDDTVAVVRGLGLPNVEVIEQDNIGFGAGNDTGTAHLPEKTEFVLFLNPDCVIEAPDLGQLVAYLDAHPRCGLVGPRLRSDDGPMTSGGALPTPLTELQPHLPRAVGRFIPQRQLSPNTTKSGTVGYVEGACMLARVQALRDVGGFDHRYFLCFEEMDLARRMAEAGWTVALCADAWATHTPQQSRSQVPRFSNYHKYRSQRLYLERWYGDAAARRYARLATLSWRTRKLFRKIDDADFRLLAAAVGGAEMPRVT